MICFCAGPPLNMYLACKATLHCLSAPHCYCVPGDDAGPFLWSKWQTGVLFMTFELEQDGLADLEA